MSGIKTTLEETGLPIPLEYRQALGIKPGDELVLTLEAGELRVVLPQQALRKAQALVRRYVPEGRSLVDELIAERRRESGFMSGSPSRRRGPRSGWR